MGQIWFGDLDFDPIDIDNYSTFKKSIDELYKIWEKKHPDIFKDFPKVFNIDIEKESLELSKDIWSVDWHNNEYLKPFILQGGPDSQKIFWGDGPSSENRIISAFTNELLKLIGDQGITFYFQVIADDGYENYSTYMYPDFENEFPNSECIATFYEDETQ
tara:strand:- start:2056 stop:2535 length:480 start_codon:yes stop_codon:yes gene_type:complete